MGKVEGGCVMRKRHCKQCGEPIEKSNARGARFGKCGPCVNARKRVMKEAARNRERWAVSDAPW